MDIPESMKAELLSWNNGKGIDLDAWIGCEGRFSLAVGYITLFWPEIVEHEGYILRKGFTAEGLRTFEKQPGATKKSIEWANNHIHLADIHYVGCEDLTKDKLIVLGNTLKEIYKTKLKWQFPNKPCIVEFYIPEDEENLIDYQISFWQETTE